MQLHARYYLWNKASDFATGTVKNIEFDDNGMYLADSSKEYGIYYSRIIDSGEHGKQWGRAEMLGEWKPNTSVTISFFASDKEINIAESEKSISFSNCRDIILKAVSGRYMCFSVRFYGSGNVSPLVKRIRIWLDNDSWLYFLPEVYQENEKSADFTSRFLSIFKKIYEDMNDKITEMPVKYNINTTDRDFLEWLAEWIGIENLSMWNDNQLRTLLLNSADLFGRTGTPKMILDMAQLYTGVRPILLENFLTADPIEALKAWKNGNYPKDPFGFTLLISADAVRSETEYQSLIKILHKCKPAHMKMQIVFADPGCLEGKNQMQSPEICLDGRATLTSKKEMKMD